MPIVNGTGPAAPARSAAGLGVALALAPASRAGWAAVIAGLGVGILLGLCAEQASALETPDATRMDELRARLEGREVRIVSALGRMIGRKAAVSDSGIGLKSMSQYDPAPGAPLAAPGVPPLVPWSAVSKVDTHGQAWSAGVAVGTGLILLGFLSAGWTPSDSAVPVLLPLIGVAPIAGLAVSLTFKKWTTVLPKRRTEE